MKKRIVVATMVWAVLGLVCAPAVRADELQATKNKGPLAPVAGGNEPELEPGPTPPEPVVFHYWIVPQSRGSSVVMCQQECHFTSNDDRKREGRKLRDDPVSVHYGIGSTSEVHLVRRVS